MPQLTAQRPRVVTLERVCEALDGASRSYVVDVYDSRRTVMMPGATATSYIDLVTGVLRMRSVWRATVSVHERSRLLPYVLHHNREAVGPRVVTYLHGNHYHLCAQTNAQVTVGMGDQQLEAHLLLALIMAERFFSSVEADFPCELDGETDFSHHDLLPKQHIVQIVPGFSDNALTAPVSVESVAQAADRLNLRVYRDGTVLRLRDSDDLMVLRLFGEDTWLSTSMLVELGQPFPAESLFDAINELNTFNTLGVTSVLGMRTQPYLRFDYLVSVGEGLSERQLDTEIVAGLSVTQNLAASLRKKAPTLFL